MRKSNPTRNSWKKAYHKLRKTLDVDKQKKESKYKKAYSRKEKPNG